MSNFTRYIFLTVLNLFYKVKYINKLTVGQVGLVEKVASCYYSGLWLQIRWR